MSILEKFLSAQRVLMSLIELSADDMILSDPEYPLQLLRAELVYEYQLGILIADRRRRAVCQHVPAATAVVRV